MNILFICKRFYTNKDLIADQFGRLFHIPKHWSQKHNIKIIALDYHQTTPCSVALPSLQLDSRPVRLLPLSLFSAFRHCLAAASTFKPDTIIASGDIITGLIGCNVASHLKKPWFFDIYDDYRYFLLSRVSGLSLWFSSLCRRATGLITVSEELANILSRWNKQIHIAPNGYDPVVFHPIDKLHSRRLLGLDKDALLIAYTGSIDNRFDVDLVQNAMPTLQQRHPTIRFLHAGANIRKRKLSGSWMAPLGMLDQNRVANVISAADICIAPYMNGPLSSTCNPCKISEYMACEKPVVAAKISQLTALESYGVNLYEAGDSASFISAMDKQIVNPIPCIPAEYWTWQQIASAYEEFITRLTLSGKPLLKPSDGN